MRILILHNAGTGSLPSGEAVVVERDARALQMGGSEVLVHVDGGARLSVRNAVRASVELFWSRRAYRDVRQLVDRYRPSIVHVHGVLPQLSASVFDAARSMGLPSVQTLHNFRWVCVEGGLVRRGEYCDLCIRGASGHGVRYGCSRSSRSISAALTLNNLLHVASGRLGRSVDRFVAVSHFVRDRHVAAGFSSAQVMVKYNNVDTDVAPSTDYRPRSVCFIGRLDRGKGVDLLIETAARLDDHHFEIIGAGTSRGDVVEAIDQHRVRARLRGRVSSAQVAETIRRCAVVLVPSRAAETFSLVAGEALACGVPVVATNRGALPELVGGSGGGLVVEPDPEALAAAIRRITSSAALRSSLGEAGRRFAREHLSLERGGQRLLEIYRAVLRG